MYMQTWYANLHIGIYTYYTCIFKITRVLLTAHIDFSTYRTPGSPFDICIPGSSWSWKFRHQSQKLSILPNSREKELMNGYFHSRTPFFASERFRAVLKAFFTLFFTLLERNFATPERPKCPERQKPFRCSFFHTHPHNCFFWGFGGVKNSSIQYWEAPGTLVVWCEVRLKGC